MDYSVVIPHGKKLHQLDRAVASLLAQTLPPSKIVIVCNNGQSPVEAANILSSVDASTLQIVDFPQATNANQARNRGADASETAWIAFLDSDDSWLPAHAETVSREIRENPDADFVYGSYEYRRADGVRHVTKARHIIPPESVEQYILSGGSTTTCAMFVKRSLFGRVRWKDTLRRHQDWDYFVRLHGSAQQSLPIPEPLVSVDWTNNTGHRDHAACISVTRNWGPKVDARLFLRYLLSQLAGSIRTKDGAGIIAVLPLLPAAVMRFSTSYIRGKVKRFA